MTRLQRVLRSQIGELTSRRATLDGAMRSADGNFGLSRRNVSQISATRGTASTSTDLKEALCEKIPLYYDLLRNLRQQYGSTLLGHITVDNLYDGLKGICTMVRESSEVDSKYGVKYRGLSLPEIMRVLPRNGHGNAPSPEAVFWLLLTGDVPTREQACSLSADWTSRRRKRMERRSGNSLQNGVVGNVLRSLPKSVPFLRRFSIALAALDADAHTKNAAVKGAPRHTLWEYVYEDSMELLAVLPAIVGLVGKECPGKVDGHVADGDWVNCLLDCLGSPTALDGSERGRTSLADFLRLYVALNADEDGGVPGVHVTQILGSAGLNGNEALAAGVLAYANEPRTGTLAQYVEFQRRVQSALGPYPKDDALGNFLLTFAGRDGSLIGHKETAHRDPRYDAILNFVKDHLPDHNEAKLSQNITRIFTTIARRKSGKDVYPDQSAIAAPVFQYYGLEDMKLNQVLLCMSRALGAVASIIWARVINAPVEHPRSCSSRTYLQAAKSAKKPKRRRSTVGGSE